jgi:PiT family inorganic phosphate transporter
MEFFLVLGIIIALLFNFANGMNDATNSIATVVATRVLTPLQAVVMAACFNFIGPLLFTTAVAKTIGKGIVSPSFMTIDVFFIGLVVAVIWVFLTTFAGLPISATHALVGGLMGAAVGAGGLDACIWPSSGTIGALVLYITASAIAGAFVFAFAARSKKEENWRMYLGIGALFGCSLMIPFLMITGILPISGILAILVFIAFSPILGLIAAFVLSLVMLRLFRNSNPKKMNSLFNRLQVVSAAFYSINHGSNDAQNGMGAITGMLVAAGVLHEFAVPVWVILISCAAISLGTLSGGWQVVKTMAKKITNLRPYQGFCAETGGGMALTFITSFGVPVSTTHAITGAIMGVGAMKGSQAVQWGTVHRIVMTWIITIPITAICGYGFFVLYKAFFP